MGRLGKTGSSREERGISVFEFYRHKTGGRDSIEWWVNMAQLALISSFKYTADS